MNYCQRMIEIYYGDRVAERSQVPLINHINEGVKILEELGCDTNTIDAFRIHPLVQSDEALKGFMKTNWALIEPKTVLLAMEYRQWANTWLSDKVYKDDRAVPTYNTSPNSGPLKEVAYLLWADKLQNYKDFLLYHKDTHPRSLELTLYFETWLTYLQNENPSLVRPAC